MIGPFVCQRSGDCCRDVVMTREEWAAIQATRPEAPAPTAHEDRRFVEYVGVCPLLAGTICTVYAVRPYNCRRFQCWKQADDTYARAVMLFPARLEQHRAVRREYARNQRKAQRWADAHGWVRTAHGDAG